MRTVFWTIFFMILSLLPGCSDSSTEGSTNIPFYPLTVGNVWQYRLIKYDTTGKNPVADTSVWIERVIGDTVIDALQWSILHTSVNTFNYSYPCRNMDKGMSVYVSKPELFFKYPPTLNERYKGFTELQVISINEPTVTLAGTFNCIVYRQLMDDRPGNTLYADHYIAPGIGKVKLAGVLTTDGTTLITRIEYSLFQYTLN